MPTCVQPADWCGGGSRPELERLAEACSNAPTQHLALPALQAGERERVAEAKRGELHALRGKVSNKVALRLIIQNAPSSPGDGG